MKNSVIATRVRLNHNYVENVFTTQKSLKKYLEYMNSFSDEPIKLINCSEEIVTINDLFTGKNSRDSYAYFHIVEGSNKCLYCLSQKPLNQEW